MVVANKYELTPVQVIGIHLLCWTFYVGYELFFDAIFPGSWQTKTNYFYFYLFNIAFFYLHAYWVLPKALANLVHAIWKVPVFVLGEIFLFVLLLIIGGVLAGDIEFVFGGFKTFVFDIEGLRYFVAPLLPYLIYATGYYFLRRYIKMQKQTKEIERQHFGQVIANRELEANLLRIEQDYLRAQINPHLLYNTLSFVNYAAKHNRDEAERAIMLLSDIMRYALEPSYDTSGFVLLSEEIQQTEKLIELNQLRFSNSLNIRLETIFEQQVKAKIIPLMLLTLVENIFKHGDLRNPEYPAFIQVKVGAGKLSITTENLIKSVRNEMASTKTGLKNLSERLSMTYANRHQFDYGQKGSLYKVYLSASLKKEEVVLLPESIST